ncbi:hypothetical protein ACFS07_36075 [Undibacterium arcticum]
MSLIARTKKIFLVGADVPNFGRLVEIGTIEPLNAFSQRRVVVEFDGKFSVLLNNAYPVDIFFAEVLFQIPRSALLSS